MHESPEPHTLGSHLLGPHVVGERVVVRHLLPDGRATDVLGTCTSWGEDVVTIESDRGQVAIAIATIVTGKPVPPRASVRSRVAPRDVEAHGLGLWPAMEQVDLGDWVLRSAPAEPGARPRKRANSALAMGDSGLPLAEATNAVHTFYEQRGQVPMVQVIQDSSYERWFVSLGWQPVVGGDSQCQLAPLSRALRTCDAVLRTLPRRHNTAEVSSTPRDTEPGGRIEVEVDGGTAHGSAALDGDWLALHGLRVHPDHRRQGMAHAVLAELLDWGASQGAMTAWLHVEDDNDAALALYASLGFVTHHANRYLVRNSSTG